eukprot:scaffold26002_cov215-Cylindrotheca_fusiformis.AAC.2
MPQPEDTQQLKRYCCGCGSRTSALIANVFKLVIGSLYFIVGIYGLNDTNPKTAPNAEERIFLRAVIGMMSIEVIVSCTAIWGLCTYRRWPVMLSLVLVVLQMLIGFVLSILAAVYTESPSFLIRMLVAYFISYFFFYMPMYGYINEYERLKALRFGCEIIQSEDDVSHEADKESLEMV